MPMTDALGRPIEVRHRSRAEPSTDTPYGRAYRHAQRTADAVNALHGVPTEATRSTKVQTDFIINLLADLTSAVEASGADEALTDALAERLLGLRPTAPVARALRQGYATGLEVVAEDGSWAHQRWRGLHNELAKLPVRRSIVRRAGACKLPAVRAALDRIQRAVRSRDSRDHQYAGAAAATLIQALCTSQAISPGGHGTVERATRAYQFRKKSGSVEVGPNFWVSEDDVTYSADGRPKLKPGAEAKYRYHDDYEGK